ncbi:hypothetical protein D779_2077 [Imhoffiella purpurea]|uniref:Uncharacterized protein n=2 Tax=Imhoffiella purpurea TaxID=1249627 RepID=W9VD21_9GAMM|nr:hypothetical protein D779_2077 [Imhoffiella purpurea]
MPTSFSLSEAKKLAPRFNPGGDLGEAVNVVRSALADAVAAVGSRRFSNLGLLAVARDRYPDLDDEQALLALADGLRPIADARWRSIDMAENFKKERAGLEPILNAAMTEMHELTRKIDHIRREIQQAEAGVADRRAKLKSASVPDDEAARLAPDFDRAKLDNRIAEIRAEGDQFARFIKSCDTADLPQDWLASLVPVVGMPRVLVPSPEVVRG